MKSSIAILITLAAVLGIYSATMRDQLRIVRCIARDDWRGARDVATSLLSRKRRRASRRGPSGDHVMPG